MMFPNPLIEVPIIELLKIWAELTEAYHGINGYGGNTAELYSYRFQRYTPSIHATKDHLSHNLMELKREIEEKAGNALVAIVEEFCRQYDCSAEIDGLELVLWCKEINYGQRAFDHRAHVTIKRGE